jgi:hypothetical protein
MNKINCGVGVLTRPNGQDARPTEWVINFVQLLMLAIATAGKFGGPAKGAIPPVIPLLQDPVQDVRGMAASMFNALGYRPQS